MRFSIREILAFTAAVGVLLTLPQLPVVVVGTLLCICVLVAYFIVPRIPWRYVVYGGIAGVIIVLVCLFGLLHLTYGQSARSRNSPAREVMDQAQPYILPLGSLLGGTVGWVAWKARRRGTA